MISSLNSSSFFFVRLFLLPRNTIIDGQKEIYLRQWIITGGFQPVYRTNFGNVEYLTIYLEAPIAFPLNRQMEIKIIVRCEYPVSKD